MLLIIYLSIYFCPVSEKPV